MSVVLQTRCGWEIPLDVLVRAVRGGGVFADARPACDSSGRLKFGERIKPEEPARSRSPMGACNDSLSSERPG
jgi:hypothetical protein